MELQIAKSNYELNIEKNLHYLFIVFCFFPYINLFHIPTDAQPNALILAIFIFFLGLKKYKYPKTAFFILLLTIPFYFLGSLGLRELDFSFFRSLLGYISLFFITMISYVSFSRGYLVSWYWFRNFVFFNIIVCILQTVLKFNFLEFLFYRVGTSDTRGVTGLTPEPTFNATIAIFCASLYLLNYYDKKRNYILLLILIWIVILAQSSTIVLMTIPVVVVYLIFKNFKVFVIPVILIFTLSYVFFSKTEDGPESSRLITILNVVASNPSKLVILDQSVNARVSNIIVPAYVSITDFMIPHGSSMVVLNNSIPEVTRTTFPDLFYFEDIAAGVERIMSGWSMMFYEIGLIAFVFFFYLIYLICFRLDHFGMQFLGGLIFIVIVFTAVTVNTSIIPFIFGNIIYMAMKNKSTQWGKKASGI